MEDVGKEMSKVMAKKEWSQRFEKLVEDVMADPDVLAFITENQETLTSEDIDKSYAKLYEFVQEKRKFLLNDPTMIAPGYEPKLFLNFHYIDVTYVPTVGLLSKQKESEIRRRVKAMDMPKDIREASMDQFELTTERKTAFEASLKFIQAYQQNPKHFHQGLYFHGSFGVGKTYLLGAIAQELAESGYLITLMHFPTFTVEMKQSIATNTTGEKIDVVKKAPILMLDDIGADSMSPWIRDEVLGVILQYRMQEQLPTFFSSNLSMERLEKEHFTFSQKGDEEPLKAKRLMERIRFLSKEITMVGDNRRNN